MTSEWDSTINFFSLELPTSCLFYIELLFPCVNLSVSYHWSWRCEQTAHNSSAGGSWRSRTLSVKTWRVISTKCHLLERNRITLLQKYFQQMHYASHLSVWSVQCALVMFSYTSRCYSKQIFMRGCTTTKKKKRAFGASDGNVRSWKQSASSFRLSHWFKTSRHRDFFVDLCVTIQYHYTRCCDRNFWFPLHLQK